MCVPCAGILSWVFPLVPCALQEMLWAHHSLTLKKWLWKLDGNYINFLNGTIKGPLRTRLIFVIPVFLYYPSAGCVCAWRWTTCLHAYHSGQAAVHLSRFSLILLIDSFDSFHGTWEKHTLALILWTLLEHQVLPANPMSWNETYWLTQSSCVQTDTGAGGNHVTKISNMDRSMTNLPTPSATAKYLSSNVKQYCTVAGKWVSISKTERKEISVKCVWQLIYVEVGW